jgi:hypothetical protein
VLTTYRTPIDPQTIIVPYLVTVIVFIVHVSEEFGTHVERYLSQLSRLQVTQSDFLNQQGSSPGSAGEAAKV